ncbi:MAG TPA: caspase family protein, partial [Blastocatellia bacterium]|nr:caspase family protein [Blastocatellia bacterium]
MKTQTCLEVLEDRKMICRKTPETRAATLWLRAAVLAVVASVIQLGFSVTAEAQTERRDLRVQPLKAIGKLPSSTKRFALIIGVDEYEDAQINKLDGASNDAKALAAALIQHAGFIKDQVFVLASDQPLERRPTRARILRQVANLQGLIPKDGLLLVAFAGHGMERGGQAYLLPSDAQLSGNISLLEQTAINVEEIKKWIRQTQVEQVVIILDACRNNPVSARGTEDNVLTEAYARAFSFDVRNAEVKAFATLYAAEVGHRAYEY